jgi:hypothetical protein
MQGAKWGANDRRHQAMAGNSQPQSLLVNGTLSDTQRH